MVKFQPRRALGRTGFVATVLGIGDIADRRIDAPTLIATLRRAMDAGLNVIDTAPGYEDGYSEQIVGQALQGRRDGMFLVDKIDFYDRPVTEQVDASLKALRVDHVDAMVFHGLSTLERWNKVVSPGGMMDELAGCVKAGKVRFRGISSHDPDTCLAAIHSGLCDVLLFSIGPYVHERYIREVLPLARQHHVGTICFKTFGAGKLLGDTSGYQQPLQDRPRGKVSSGGAEEQDHVLPRLSVEDCLHYTLTLDPDVALLGLSFPNEQDAAFAAARSFKPLPPDGMADIKRRGSEAIANKGKVWWNPGGI
jgi:aryl-alcohol dehydrogenase-like predicted oxidoreductase